MESLLDKNGKGDKLPCFWEMKQHLTEEVVKKIPLWAGYAGLADQQKCLHTYCPLTEDLAH